MTARRCIYHAVSAYALAISACSGARAATQPTEPSAAESASDQAHVAAPTASPDQLQEIVVVARRTAENLQSVPISITAVNQEQIRSASITKSSDLINVVPSLSVGESTTGSGNSYAIRGIRTGVVTYFAEVPIDTGGVSDQLWDLNTVQALAGPQGTLFGRNSTGGAILFVPQRPTAELGGYLEAGYGNYDAKRLTGVVNLPIAQGLSIRLGGQLIRRDGVVKNLIGPDLQSQHRNAFRASMLFEPGDGTFSDYLVADYSDRDERPNAFITSGVTATTGCFAGLGCLYGPGSLYGGTAPSTLQALQDQLGIRKVSESFPNRLTAQSYGVSNTAQLKFLDGDLTFRYIFGYRHFKQRAIANQTQLDLPIENILNDTAGTPTYTNELQLLGKALNDRLKVTIGGFLLHTNGGLFTNSTQLFGNPALPFSNDDNIENLTHSNLNTRAVYSQATFAVVENLNLTAGVRLNRDRRSSDDQSFGPEFTFLGPRVCRINPTAVGFDPATCTLTEKATDKATTYNFSVDYHVSPKVLVYATTRRGYNAGGFNTSGVPSSNDPTAPQASFGPEYLTDYEIGVKPEWRVGNILARTNVAVYYGKYKNIQRLAQGVSADGVPFEATGNAGKATVYGVQIESTFRLSRELIANINYGYLHTGYDVGTIVFPKSNAFAQAPKHTLNASLDYTHALSVGGALQATGGLTYQSKIAFFDNNLGNPKDFQGGYVLMNGRLAWNNVAGSHFGVDVYVKNMLNKRYAYDLQDQSSIFGISTEYGDPRTFGVELRYEF